MWLISRSTFRYCSSKPILDTFRLPLKTVGCLRESVKNGEQRVATTPSSAALLHKKGVDVLVEKGAGESAGFLDGDYTAAGARIVGDRKQIIQESDLLCRLKYVNDNAIERKAVIGVVQPGINKDLYEKMLKMEMTCIALDCVPRITRAQSYDVLSSMANIAGYRAVIEAASSFGRFFTGQMTAAGRVPPAKILIVGGGVAGLSAAATARNMGAITRVFDTRPAVAEQVKSLGGEFLKVPGFTLEEGSGGYGKVMTKEFIEAEMELFRNQCKEVDIVITTALIPGQKAPILITKDMIESMRPGSVVVDLAAEMGGNIETTKVNEKYIYKNVVHIGYTDLPSRLPNQSSTLYANNMTKLILSMIIQNEKKSNELLLDLNDDVTRGCLICFKGERLFPPKVPIVHPTPVAKIKPKVEDKEKAKVKDLFDDTLNSSLAVTGSTCGIASLGILTGDPSFMNMTSVFALSGFAGYQSVWGVTPALHTPLMSVTNAISGVTVVGGLILLGDANAGAFGKSLGGIATMISAINIGGGFTVTKRMLDMFKRPNDAERHDYLYMLPAVLLPSLCIGGSYMGFEAMSSFTYLSSSLCCLSAVGGLASQKTAAKGNVLGIIGITSGVAATISCGSSVLLPMSLIGIGGLVGIKLGQNVSIQQLPQTVAGFHSLVGAAAMITSIGSFLAHPDGSEIHKIASIAGNFIGGVTLSGSIVAFAKLQGLMSSKPLNLPNKNALNICGVLTQLTLGSIICLSSSSPLLSMSCMYATAVLSNMLGYHLVASVGGADMPVCITVLNAYSGLALVAEGFLMSNYLMTTIGSLIASSGGILSYIMCRAMNRSLTNVLFGGYGIIQQGSGSKILKSESQTHKEIRASEVGQLMNDATKIIIVPGYGMAVSKAQYILSDLTKKLKEKNIDVKYAIHPVAGRMPGQMNVLLAEAGVPYDLVYEMDEVNSEFCETDITLVVGANDITNSAAEEDPNSPIKGMPVLRVWDSKHCIFFKRSMGAGYADIENPVFFKPNTSMLLGDAKQSAELILKAIGEANL